MSWAAVIAGGAALAGSVYQSQQGKKAGDKSVAGAQAGIDEQRRQFDLIMSMLGPQRQVGTNALNSINRLYGYGNLPTNQGGGIPGSASGVMPAAAPVAAPKKKKHHGGLGGFISNLASPKNFVHMSVNPIGATKAALGNGTSSSDLMPQNIIGFNGGQGSAIKADPAQQYAMMNGGLGATPQEQGAPDMSVFFNSPDYQFRRNEGTRDINNSFAARGGALSGNALRAVTDYNSNLAAGEYGNFFNRLLSQAGLGQVATNQGVNAAQYAGGNVSNLLNAQGNARASGIVDQTNGVTGGLNNLAGIYGSWMRNRQGG